MKLTKQKLRQVIEEILRLNKSGETEKFGPPKEIDAIYNDSSDHDSDGYTSMNRKMKVRIYKNEDPKNPNSQVRNIGEEECGCNK